MGWRTALRLAAAVVLLGSILVTTSGVPAHAAGTSYRDAVMTDAPSVYYRYNEASGASLADESGNNRTGTTYGSPVLGQGGALLGTADNAVRMRTGSYALTPPVAATNTFSLETWFKTTSTHGGRLIGYGASSPTSESTSYDRIVHMDNTGRLSFAVYAGFASSIQSGNSYNDGAWHHVAATLGANGLNLYVDGTSVASDPSVTAGEANSAGRWRIGYDTLNGFPNGGDSRTLAASIDETAIWYSSTLSAAQIANHFAANPRADADWNAVYATKRSLRITAADALLSGFTATYSFDHAALVTAGAMTSGNDLRIARWDGLRWQEVDRVLTYGSGWNLTTTSIDFRLQAPVAAGATDTSYALFTRWTGAAAPPNDGNSVYSVYDDFSAATLDTDKWISFAQNGMAVDIASGTVRVSGTSANDGSAYNYNGIYGRYNLDNFSADGYRIDATFRIANQVLRANQSDYHWKTQLGFSEDVAAVHTDGPATATYYSNQWNAFGNSTLNGQFPTARVSTKRVGSTITYSENGTVIGTRSTTSTSSQSGSFSGASNVFNDTYDYRWSDVRIQRAVTNGPTVTLNVAPSAPTSLAQFSADGTSAVPVGGYADGVTPVFKAATSDTNTTDRNQLCVEVKPIGVAFTNSETGCGSLVAQGGTAIWTAGALADATQYHWQARTRDVQGAYSPWSAFGGNSDTVPADADFVVNAAAPWWNNAYDKRLAIPITAAAGNAVPSGYSVSLTFDHAALVRAGAKANGEDLRVVYYNGTTTTELDRVLAIPSPRGSNGWNTTNTKLWFKTLAPINAGANTTGYFLYYGNASAGVAPADPTATFDLWDDFSTSGVPDAGKWTVSAQSGITVSKSAGELVVTGTSAAGSETATSGIRTAASTNAGYLLESSVRIVSQGSGSEANWRGDFGGRDALLVQSDAATVKRIGYTSGSFVPVGSSTLSGSTVSTRRVAEAVTGNGVAKHFEDGALLASRTGGPTGVGTPTLGFAPMVASQSFDVRYDNVLLRKYVDVEPTARVNVPDAKSSLAVSVSPHAGSCNGVSPSGGATVTANGFSFETTAQNTYIDAAQDVIVSTNATSGFTSYIRADGAFSNGGHAMALVSGSNAAPSAFPAATVEAFGYSTSSADLTGGVRDRFTNPGAQWAALTPSNAPVASSTRDANGLVTCVSQRLSVALTTPPGRYHQQIVLTTVPNF